MKRKWTDGAPRRLEHYVFLILMACVLGAIIANLNGGIIILLIIAWLGTGVVCAAIPDDDRRD